MANAQIYTSLAKKKNIPISELESILGVGSSTIAKAIKRNSLVRPGPAHVSNPVPGKGIFTGGGSGDSGRQH